MKIMIGLIRPLKVILLDEITTSLDVSVRQDLLHWLVKESNERGATILYATHIFYGLYDCATHLHYLKYEVKCGWKGNIQYLDKYQKLKEENHPSKMLAIADHWLRAELDRNRRSRRAENHKENCHNRWIQLIIREGSLVVGIFVLRVNRLSGRSS